MATNLYPDTSWKALFKASFYPSMTAKFFLPEKQIIEQWGTKEKVCRFAIALILSTITVIPLMLDLLNGTCNFACLVLSYEYTLQDRYYIIQEYAKSQNRELTSDDALTMAKQSQGFSKRELKTMVKTSQTEREALIGSKQSMTKRQHQYLHTAIHEAGHAFCVLAANECAQTSDSKGDGNVFQMRDLRISPSISFDIAMNSAGVASYEYSQSYTTSLDGRKRLMEATLGGRAAEKVFNDVIKKPDRFGYLADYISAWSEEREYWKLQDKTTARSIAPSVAKTDQFARNGSLETSVADCARRRFSNRPNLLRESLQTAEEKITANKERVREMAIYLQTYEVLSQEDVEAIYQGKFDSAKKDRELIARFNFKYMAESPMVKDAGLTKEQWNRIPECYMSDIDLDETASNFASSLQDAVKEMSIHTILKGLDKKGRTFVIGCISQEGQPRRYIIRISNSFNSDSTNFVTYRFSKTL